MDKERRWYSQKVILHNRIVIRSSSRESDHLQVSEDTNVCTFRFINVQETIWVELICVCTPDLRKTEVVSVATALVAWMPHRLYTPMAMSTGVPFLT